MYRKIETKVKFKGLNYLDMTSFLNFSLLVEKALMNVVSKREEKLIWLKRIGRNKMCVSM